MVLVRCFSIVAMLGALVLGFATPMTAATVSFFGITDDASSQISSAKTYTHAIDFGTNPATAPVATINGVVFTGRNGAGAFTGPGGSATINTGSANPPSGHGGGGATNVTGAIHNLLDDFNYNAPNTVIQVSGLTIGQTYDLRLYHRQWGATDDRRQQFGFDANGVGGSEISFVLNPDNATANPPGLDVANRAHAVSFVYQAWSPTATITANMIGAGTYHLYGLTNEVVGPLVTETLYPLKRLFNTGVDNQGRVLAPGSADPHYTMTAVPAGSPFVPPAPAVVEANHPVWLANDAVGTVGSSFISTDANGAANITSGNYVTETILDLTGWDHQTARIHGAVISDNVLQDIRLNGQSLGISYGASLNQFFDFEIPVGSGFVRGANKLEFLWENTGATPNPGGLRLELQALAGRGEVVAIPGLFNTGVDAGGAALPNLAASVDPHYQITVNPDGTGPDAHVQDETVFPIAGPWLDNTAEAKWIAPRFDTAGSAGGIYEYTTTFDLSNFAPDTAEIHGQWATDNGGLQILLNGTVVDSGNLGFAQLDSFSIPIGSPFLRGLNTLTFRVQNDSVGYTGLFITGLEGTAAPIPEPAGLTLLVLGSLGLLVIGRRRFACRIEAARSDS